MLSTYSKIEEKLNIRSHALGLILSVFGCYFLILQALKHDNIKNILSVVVFGLSLIILYAASTLYHCTTNQQKRKNYQIFDHIAIYILIAGTYTPFTLIVLKGVIGWSIFIISWSFALIGITLKIFFTGKYDLISTAMYVFMGWLIIFAIKPLIQQLPQVGLYWLVAGGIAYTFGAIIYSLSKIKFNHAIFHLFVLIGSLCHFISVYFYVLPS